MFCSTWHMVLKMFARLLQIKSKGLEKSVAEAIYRCKLLLCVIATRD